MNQQQATFDNTVGVLVRAYLAGVLECTDCAACACGNIVAAANGYTVTPFTWHNKQGEELDWPKWQEVVWDFRSGHKYRLDPLDREEGAAQVDSAGYSVRDFERIESAFMDATTRNDADKDAENFTRLMAVVDVLADIHGVDLTTAEAAKALFVKA